MKQFPQAVHPSLHFDKINENVIVPLGLKLLNVERGEASMKLTLGFQLTDPVMTLDRSVTIHQLDYDGLFRVECVETWPEFEFDLKKETFEINSNFDPTTPNYQDSPVDMGYCYRRIATFLREEFKPHLWPTRAQFAKRDEVNSRFLTEKKYKVELYNESSHRADWRFMMVAKDGTVLTRHLDIERADSHTYMLFGSAIENSFKRAVVEGRLQMADEIVKEAYAKATANMPNYEIQRHPEVAQALSPTGIRTDKNTI